MCLHWLNEQCCLKWKPALLLHIQNIIISQWGHDHDQLPIKYPEHLVSDEFPCLTIFYKCCPNSLPRDLSASCCDSIGRDAWKIVPDFLGNIKHVLFFFFLLCCSCFIYIFYDTHSHGTYKSSKWIIETWGLLGYPWQTAIIYPYLILLFNQQKIEHMLQWIYFININF